MKNLYILLTILLISSNLKASHIVGGEISIQHIQGFDYKISMILYRDQSGIGAPPTAVVEAYQRLGTFNVGSFTLPMDSNNLLQPITIGCGSPLLTVESYYYSAVVTFNPSTFNHPSGYLFYWSSCCRNAGVANLQGSASQGSTIITMFPPIVKPNGNPIFNSTPILTSPISDFAINNHPYYLNFGGIDPDGDSLSFVLYTPFEDGSLNPGVTSSISPVYSDPSTMFYPVLWANCYNVDNQINGFSDSSCSSLNEPDRLKINPITGELTMTPGAASAAYFVFGVWCREFRNGELIGSVFRDFQISVSDNILDPNTAPQVHVPQLQALATWSGDTMVFTGSPVCVQLGVTDPDPIADIEIEAVYSDYDDNDLVFLQSYAIINNPDTFNTALCFQPDSFVANTTRGDVVALNPGCYDLRGDTLPFYFKFVGYSNAGWGGNQTVPFIYSNTGTIDLFSRMNYNPYPGGTWIDLDSTGHMSSNGFLERKFITQPKTYRFLYIEQQVNYPADTGYLELNFVYPNSIDQMEENELAIFPNPANNTISITGIIQNSEFTIYNIQGEEVLKQEVSKESNQISTESLKDGMYFYRLSGLGNKSGKLIINH